MVAGIGGRMRARPRVRRQGGEAGRGLFDGPNRVAIRDAARPRDLHRANGGGTVRSPGLVSKPVERERNGQALANHIVELGRVPGRAGRRGNGP